jgi:hypothetical protein
MENTAISMSLSQMPETLEPAIPDAEDWAAVQLLTREVQEAEWMGNAMRLQLFSGIRPFVYFAKLILSTPRFRLTKSAELAP